MIKSLRQRFIAIAMCSIIIVLSIIIGTINIIGYYNVNKSAGMRLDLLLLNNGSFPSDAIHREPFDDKKNEGTENEPSFLGEDALDGNGEDFRFDNRMHKMSAEAPFDTRFFTVTIDDSGAVVSVSTDHIAAVSAEDATEYALMLHEKGRTGGFWNYYKYAEKNITSENGTTSTLYIFLDCQRELETFQNFLFASVGISFIGLLLVLILVVLLSGRVVKPIAESYEKQRHFITDASHEIKTPLTIIDANTEVLEMVNGENEWTQSIRNQIRRLTELTNKLVFLSRMDEEATKLTMLDFSLSDAVEETAQPFEAVAASQQKTFIYEITPAISYKGDEANLRQLTSLLLDNAMKYSSENGTIRLTLRSSGKSKVLTVQNTVDSIEPGRHNEFFERFYRADASRNSSTGGHGIGLSVARAIVVAHKGKITAHSEDGHSITFTVIL